MVQDGLRWLKTVQDGTRWFKRVQDGSRSFKDTFGNNGSDMYIFRGF
jgi:hypothetical protein